MTRCNKKLIGGGRCRREITLQKKSCWQHGGTQRYLRGHLGGELSTYPSFVQTILNREIKHKILPVRNLVKPKYVEKAGRTKSEIDAYREFQEKSHEYLWQLLKDIRAIEKRVCNLQLELNKTVEELFQVVRINKTSLNDQQMKEISNQGLTSIYSKYHSEIDKGEKELSELNNKILDYMMNNSNETEKFIYEIKELKTELQVNMLKAQQIQPQLENNNDKKKKFNENLRMYINKFNELGERTSTSKKGIYEQAVALCYGLDKLVNDKGNHDIVADLVKISKIFKDKTDGFICKTKIKTNPNRHLLPTLINDEAKSMIQLKILARKIILSDRKDIDSADRFVKELDRYVTVVMRHPCLE